MNGLHRKGLVFCFVSTNYHPADRNNIREWETGNATNLVDRVENTKLGARGVTEIILPIVHGLRRVQHGSKTLSVSLVASPSFWAIAWLLTHRNQS